MQVSIGPYGIHVTDLDPSVYLDETGLADFESMAVGRWTWMSLHGGSSTPVSNHPSV